LSARVPNSIDANQVGANGGLDVCDLRGRRVDGARFGQFNIAHHIWVDGKGTVRYMVRPGGGSGLSDADYGLAEATLTADVAGGL
jgi:hypothetical protein